MGLKMGAIALSVRSFLAQRELFPPKVETMRFQTGMFSFKTGTFSLEVGMFSSETGTIVLKPGMMLFETGMFSSETGMFSFQTGTIAFEVGTIYKRSPSSKLHFEELKDFSGQRFHDFAACGMDEFFPIRDRL